MLTLTSTPSIGSFAESVIVPYKTHCFNPNELMPVIALTSVLLRIYSTSASATASYEIIVFRSPKIFLNSNWECIRSYTGSSVNLNSSPVDFENLEAYGDDVEYFYTYKSNRSNDDRTELHLNINGDTGSNYTQQELAHYNGSTVYAYRYTSNTNFQIGHSMGQYMYSDGFLRGDSGNDRMINSKAFASGTSGGYFSLQRTYGLWGNTSDTIDKLSFSTLQNVTLDDVKINLYRRVV